VSAGAIAAERPAVPVVNPWIVAVAVMFATFMEILDTTVVNVSLPHIAGSLSASIDESTWALTSYLVANAIVLPLTGWLANYFGRKRLLLISISGFTIGAICGLTAALAMTRLMKSLLFEVSPADPVTYVAASAGLIHIATPGAFDAVSRDGGATWKTEQIPLPNGQRSKSVSVALDRSRNAHFAMSAVVYGPRILSWLDTDLFHDAVTVCILLAMAFTTWSIVKIVRTILLDGSPLMSGSPNKVESGLSRTTKGGA